MEHGWGMVIPCNIITVTWVSIRRSSVITNVQYGWAYLIISIHYINTIVICGRRYGHIMPILPRALVSIYAWLCMGRVGMHLIWRNGFFAPTSISVYFCIDKVYKDICEYIWLPEDSFVYLCIIRK